MRIVGGFCDGVSHPEADAIDDQLREAYGGGGFVTIGDIEENVVPELRAPEVPSTELKRFRKGVVKQMIKLDVRAVSASKGRLTPTASEFGISA